MNGSLRGSALEGSQLYLGGFRAFGPLVLSFSRWLCFHAFFSLSLQDYRQGI